MANNEILPFAQGVGANVQTQGDYATEALRTSGNVAGIARSNVNNKALRQASVIASALAQYIADNQPNDVTDSLTPAAIAVLLSDALKAGLGVTAPQFDNDTSIATTAFVQRALGSFSGYVSYSSNTQLSAADAGKLIVGAGNAAPITFTLPPVADFPVGTAFRFSGNAQPFPPLIAARAGENLARPDGTLGSVQMTTNGTLLVVKTESGNWFAVDGTDSLKFMSSLFGSSLLVNGHQKLASGMIRQWGVTSLPSNTTLDITLPITFPNQALWSSCSFAYGLGGLSGRCGSGLLNNSTLRLEVVVPGTSAQQVVHWEAIGK